MMQCGMEYNEIHFLWGVQFVTVYPFLFLLRTGRTHTVVLFLNINNGKVLRKDPLKSRLDLHLCYHA